MAIIVIIVIVGAVYGVSHTGTRKYEVKVDRHGRTTWKQKR